jgi:galactitol PTS system EIIA component
MSTPNILNLLEPAATSFHLTAKNSAEVISHLGKSLFEAGYVRESFVDAALDREKELPTGLPLQGNINAAIPHTDAEHVVKSGLAMATLAKPVIFHNMAIPEETVSVQLVFLLALNQPKTQIETLQAVAELLQKPEIVGQLMEANHFDDIKRIFSIS